MVEHRVCICGCSEKFKCKINSKQKYIFGHWGKVNRDWIKIGHTLNSGKKCSNEKKKKISDSLLGHKFTEETKQKISNTVKKQFILKERVSPMKGKHHSLETLIKIKRNLPDMSGINNSFYNKKHTKETKKHLSLIHGGTGIPYEINEYDDKFNQSLRDKIRERDNYQCQNCSMTEEEHLTVFGTNLHCHHIDYNKKNSIEENLMSLCFSCHHRTNYNRIYWKELLNKIIKGKNKCKIIVQD